MGTSKHDAHDSRGFGGAAPRGRVALRYRWTLTATLLATFALPASADAQPRQAGIWDGMFQCAGMPPGAFQVVLATTGTPAGLLVLPELPPAGFSTPLHHIQVTPTSIHVEAVLPNGQNVVLDGQVQANQWAARIQQGPYVCQALLSHTRSMDWVLLPIPPSYQAEPMWCWLTVGEMVFRHFGVVPPAAPTGGTTQCEILASISLGAQNQQCAQNCSACRYLGGGSMREVAGMLSDYPSRLARMGRPTRRLFSAITPPLPFDEVRAELEAGRPVIIGINPGQSFAIQRSLNPFLPPMHVALIVGYARSDRGVRYFINDPYPFPVGPQAVQNPYLQAGAQPMVVSSGAGLQSVAYSIPIESLAALSWTESILVRP